MIFSRYLVSPPNALTLTLSSVSSETRLTSELQNMSDYVKTSRIFSTWGKLCPFFFQGWALPPILTSVFSLRPYLPTLLQHLQLLPARLLPSLSSKCLKSSWKSFCWTMMSLLCFSILSVTAKWLKTTLYTLCLYFLIYLIGKKEK